MLGDSVQGSVYSTGTVVQPCLFVCLFVCLFASLIFVFFVRLLMVRTLETP